MNKVNFQFLDTEKTISEKCGKPINFPIKVFSLEQIGIDSRGLFNLLRPNYYELEWDYYDVRKEQITFLSSVFKDQKKYIRSMYADFYENKITLTHFGDLLQRLSTNELSTFLKIQPYRNRSVSKFHLIKLGGSWKIEEKEIEAFVQNVNDYRTTERMFPKTSKAITQNKLFLNLLKKIALMIESINPGVTKLEIINHETGTLASNFRDGDNSPEGIHQDGVDYVVSALVIERKNIKEGISNIFLNDDKIYSRVLKTGEGILHADVNSDLYHNVTKVKLDDKSKELGFRYILGFDIDILA